MRIFNGVLFFPLVFTDDYKISVKNYHFFSICVTLYRDLNITFLGINETGFYVGVFILVWNILIG